MRVEFLIKLYATIMALSTYLHCCNTRAKKRQSHLFSPSGGPGWSRDLSPGLESFPQFLTILGRGKPMPARAEVLCDGTIGREETLGLARGLKPLHAPLPLTGRLVRVLCTIIEIPVLAMFHPRENLSLCSCVALQLIGDEHPRHVPQALE